MYMYMCVYVYIYIYIYIYIYVYTYKGSSVFAKCPAPAEDDATGRRRCILCIYLRIYFLFNIEIIN